MENFHGALAAQPSPAPTFIANLVIENSKMHNRFENIERFVYHYLITLDVRIILAGDTN